MKHKTPLEACACLSVRNRSDAGGSVAFIVIAYIWSRSMCCCSRWLLQHSISFARHKSICLYTDDMLVDDFHAQKTYLLAPGLSLPSCVVGLTATPLAAAQDLMSCPSCPTCPPLARRLKPTKTARRHLLQPLATLSTRRWLLLALSLNRHWSLQEPRLTLVAAAAAAILVAALRGAIQHAAASCQQLLLPKVQAGSQ